VLCSAALVSRFVSVAFDLECGGALLCRAVPLFRGPDRDRRKNKYEKQKRRSKAPPHSK
jgi:hypothetical protein